MVDRNWRIDDSFQDEALVMNSQFVLPLITKYAMSDPGITHKGNHLYCLSSQSMPCLTQRSHINGHEYIITNDVTSSSCLESLQVLPYDSALL